MMNDMCGINMSPFQGFTSSSLAYVPLHGTLWYNALSGLYDV